MLGACFDISAQSTGSTLGPPGCMFYDSALNICWDDYISAIRFRKEPPGTQPPVIISISKPSSKGQYNKPDVVIGSNKLYEQSENSIFVNPRTPRILINSNNSTSYGGVSFFMSSNSGQTWKGDPLGPGGLFGSNVVDPCFNMLASDPACVIDVNGYFYVNYIRSCAQGISISRDQGITWNHNFVSSLVFINGSDSNDILFDKNHLWVDNSPTSFFNGNLYCSWTRFTFGYKPRISFSRSTDQGITWSAPVDISSELNAGYSNSGVNIATGAGGQVYACWAIFDNGIVSPPPKPIVTIDDETAIGFAKNLAGGAVLPSESNGAGWHAKRAIDNIKGIIRGAGLNIRVNSFPVMTVDQQNGNIYIVWTNRGVPGVNSGNPDIYLIKSLDEGDTWSSPIRVNQDAANSSAKQWFPWISCDPVSGILAIIFYDTRNASASNPNLTETFVAISTDDGNTWKDFVVSDVAFSLAPTPGILGDYAGDYIGISIYNYSVYPVWTDNRNGIMLTYTSPFNVNLEHLTNQHISPLKTNYSAVDTRDSLIIGDNQYSGNKILFLNPVRNHIIINYYLESSSHVEIKIFDLKGELVMNDKIQFLPEGTYSDLMDISDLPNSLYMVNVNTNHYNITNKMVVIR